MKHSSITFIFILLTIFLLSNSFLCELFQKHKDYVELCFTVEPESGNTNTVFTFRTNCSVWETDCPQAELYWAFGDGVTQSALSYEITHRFNSPGEYLVTLDSAICYDYDLNRINKWTGSYKDWITVEEASGNHSPHADFTVTPTQGTLNTVFSFDASSCWDDETPVSQLLVRWDWTNDGTYDDDFATTKAAQHKYTEAGTFTVTLQVKDADGATGKTSKDVQVSQGTPPVASFTITPESGNTLTTFTFDASASSDLETPQSDLVVVWDFENDGIWDTEPTNYKIAYHQYSSEGHHEIKLWVRDADLMDDYKVKTLEVNNCINGGEPCQGIPTVSYEGYVYHTVQIGDQCWLKENLNVGNRIDHGTSQTDNQLIEKYCYDDQESYCDLYGGLYQWYEMMNYTEVSGTQGICPPGWHIPTESEFDVLAETLGGMLVAGSKMKACTDDWQFHYQVNSNESGFTGLPAGYYASSGSSFVSQGQRTRYFGSFYYTYARQLSYDGSSFGKVGAMPLGEALSVRCIKDSK
jgi:uncharacterized protein (TIGR02145 family)